MYRTSSVNGNYWVWGYVLSGVTWNDDHNSGTDQSQKSEGRLVMLDISPATSRCNNTSRAAHNHTFFSQLQLYNQLTNNSWLQRVIQHYLPTTLSCTLLFPHITYITTVHWGLIAVLLLGGSRVVSFVTGDYFQWITYLKRSFIETNINLTLSYNKTNNETNLNQKLLSLMGLKIKLDLARSISPLIIFL